jgi:pimeloyl-ACP methyl ester carboxylesterase
MHRFSARLAVSEGAMATLKKDSTDGGKPLHLILVHGTWGRGLPLLARRSERGASWCRDGSLFLERLRLKLEKRSITHKTSQFLWSGANTFSERDLAARKLADNVAGAARRLPAHRHVIVAHSHGGNIALRALQLLDDESRNRINPALVTIATPFIIVRADGRGRTLKAAAFYMAVGAVLTLLYAKLFLPADMPVFWLLLILIVPLVTKAYLVGPFVEWLHEIGSSRARALAEAARSDPLCGDRSVLIVRGMEDEASMVLMLGTIGVRLADLFTGTIFLLMIFGIAVFVLTAIAALIAYVMGNSIDAVAAPAASALGMPVTVSLIDSLYTYWITFAACLAAGFIIPGFFKAAYGTELLLGAGSVSITANSAPDVNGAIQVVTLDRGSQGEFPLLHSLYDHPACPEVIAEWLSGESSPADLVRSVSNSLVLTAPWQSENGE